MFESGNHRPNWHCSWWEIPICVEKIKGNWQKNVTETECLAFYHQKSSQKSACSCRMLGFFFKWHCFSEEKWFYCNQLYGESSTKTCSLAVLIPVLRPGLKQSVKAGYPSTEICVLLTGPCSCTQDLAESPVLWTKPCPKWGWREPLPIIQGPRA